MRQDVAQLGGRGRREVVAQPPKVIPPRPEDRPGQEQDEKGDFSRRSDDVRARRKCTP
jgi:hypothetical protein